MTSSYMHTLKILRMFGFRWSIFKDLVLRDIIFLPTSQRRIAVYSPYPVKFNLLIPRLEILGILLNQIDQIDFINL